MKFLDCRMQLLKCINLILPNIFDKCTPILPFIFPGSVWSFAFCLTLNKLQYAVTAFCKQSRDLQYGILEKIHECTNTISENYGVIMNKQQSSIKPLQLHSLATATLAWLLCSTIAAFKNANILKSTLAVFKQLM